MDLAKQDRNGVRTPVDVERRYNLGKIKETEKRVGRLEEEREIDDKLSLSSTNAVQNKVITKEIQTLDKNKISAEEGKGLSSNDFTDEDKKAIHTHSNKEILDNITQEDIEKWNKIQYHVGDVYITTNNVNPNEALGYGLWNKILEQEITEKSITYYMWVRTN